MRWQPFVNPVVIWLLRSPAQGLLSSATLALTFQGRRSGQSYTVPVNYVMQGQEALVISPRTHTWWRNLIDGATVTVYLQGRRVRCVGQAFTAPDIVADGLLVFLRRAARYQRSLGVRLDARGEPRRREDLTRVAERYALVRLTPVALVGEVATGEEARCGAGAAP